MVSPRIGCVEYFRSVAAKSGSGEVALAFARAENANGGDRSLRLVVKLGRDRHATTEPPVDPLLAAFLPRDSSCGAVRLKGSEGQVPYAVQQQKTPYDPGKRRRRFGGCLVCGAAASCTIRTVIVHQSWGWSGQVSGVGFPQSVESEALNAVRCSQSVERGAARAQRIPLIRRI